MQEHLTTTRLQLQWLSSADAGFILELLNSEGWLRFIGDRKVRTPEEAEAYIVRIRQTTNLYYWAVRTRGTNEPIGIVSFLKRSYLDHFDIGFAFLPRHHGMGYALEATRAVLQLALGMPQHACVLATTMEGNTASIRLLEKMGMRFSHQLLVDEQPMLIYRIDAQQAPNFAAS